MGGVFIQQWTWDDYCGGDDAAAASATDDDDRLAGSFIRWRRSVAVEYILRTCGSSLSAKSSLRRYIHRIVLAIRIKMRDFVLFPPASRQQCNYSPNNSTCTAAAPRTNYIAFPESQKRKLTNLTGRALFPTPPTSLLSTRLCCVVLCLHADSHTSRIGEIVRRSVLQTGLHDTTPRCCVRGSQHSMRGRLWRSIRPEENAHAPSLVVPNSFESDEKCRTETT